MRLGAFMLLQGVYTRSHNCTQLSICCSSVNGLQTVRSSWSAGCLIDGHSFHFHTDYVLLLKFCLSLSPFLWKHACQDTVGLFAVTSHATVVEHGIRQREREREIGSTLFCWTTFTLQSLLTIQNISPSLNNAPSPPNWPYGLCHVSSVPKYIHNQMLCTITSYATAGRVKGHMMVLRQIERRGYLSGLDRYVHVREKAGGRFGCGEKAATKVEAKC